MKWTKWENIRPGGCQLEHVIYEKKHAEHGGGVARITINRPEKMNAFDSTTVRNLFLAFDDASLDPSIGVVVLTGAGDRAFCTGGDVSWEEEADFRLTFYAGAIPNHLLRLCSVPVIAAVKGYAIGGGNHLAYMCDVTIAADNAIFGQMGPRIGSPADGWVAAYLTRVVGAKKAREMWMWARQYTAQEALEMGLVNRVVPLSGMEEEVDRWCEEVLALSPSCIRILKASFDVADHDPLIGLEGIVGRRMSPRIWESPEVKEAHQAFREKRPPDFWGVTLWGGKETEKGGK